MGGIWGVGIMWVKCDGGVFIDFALPLVDYTDEEGQIVGVPNFLPGAVGTTVDLTSLLAPLERSTINFYRRLYLFENA